MFVFLITCMNIRLWCFSICCMNLNLNMIWMFLSKESIKSTLKVQSHLSSVLFASSTAMVPKLKCIETYVDYSLYCCFLQVCFWQFSFAIFKKKTTTKKHINGHDWYRLSLHQFCFRCCHLIFVILLLFLFGGVWMPGEAFLVKGDDHLWTLYIRLLGWY